MSHSPPMLSPVSQAFARLLGRSAKLSAGQAWTVALSMLLILSLLDWRTGRVSILPLYLAAICFAGWTLRTGAALAFTLVTVVSMTMVGHVTWAVIGPVPLGPVAEAWNASARFISFAMVAMLVGGLRTALELERWRADTDGLTGVLNKAAFQARMGDVITASRRRGGALVLAYMDLDGFKGVNDQHGHSAGDRVLIAFARAADEATRRTDLFARIGGDEFVALLSVPDCDRGDAVAEMLHHRLTGILRHTGFPVTCSMGAVVMASAQVDDEEPLISLADGLMYEVKRAGKNALRICRADRLGGALRRVFPPQPAGDMAMLLNRIDLADAVSAERLAA